MPEKRASRTGNGSHRIARRKREDKEWAPGRTGKVETEKGTAGRAVSRAETRPGGSTRAAAEVGACKTEMGAYRTLAAQGEMQGGIPAPWEPNQEARLVGGAASGVCTAAVSDS